MSTQKSITWPPDQKDALFLPTSSEPAGLTHPSPLRNLRLRKSLGRLVRWTTLATLLLTLFFWSGGKFDRFTGGEDDLWIVDAFVRNARDGRGRTLRGKAAERLYL